MPKNLLCAMTTLFLVTVSMLSRPQLATAASAGENDYVYGLVGDSACTDPPSNLVSWWGADGNAYDMVGSAHGTELNGATYAPGIVGQAFDLTGGGDYVQMAGASTGDFGANPFTVDFWLLFPPPPPAGPHAYVLGKSHPDGGQGWDVRLYSRGDGTHGIVLSGVNGWAFNIFSTDPVTPNAWHHIALAGTTTDVTLYIDGQAEGSSGRQPISTASNPFRVGMTTNYGGTDLDGLVDELEIFDRALSQSEVQAIYDAGGAGKCRSCVTPPADMVSWWEGEGNGRDSAAANHGTLMNGATFAAGEVGQAFSLDGVDDYVSVPLTTPLPSGAASRTIETWFRTSAAADQEILYYGTAAASGNSTYMLIDDTADCVPASATPYGGYKVLVGTWGANLCGTTQANDGQWHHAAATYDGTTWTLYVDGVPQTSTAGLVTNTATDSTMVIGRTKPGIPWAANPFDGLIDEVTIYGRALTAEEIAAIYNAGSAGKCRPYSLDHFLCYKVKPSKGEPKFENVPGVDLEDLFEARKFDLVKPRALCNPADKNGEGISDPATHLEAYRIKSSKTDPPQPKFTKRMNIRVTDQFGALVVDAVKPQSLLVPTAKSLQGPVDPPDPQGYELDHFECYKAKPRKKVCWGDPSARCKSDDDCGQASPCLGKFPQALQVSIEDQLTSPPRLYRVVKPAALCLPVDKNGEGIKRPDDRLMCYQVTQVKKTCQAGSPQNALAACKKEEDCGGVRGQTALCVKQPKREKVLRIHVNNQLGPEVLDAAKELQLCVPPVTSVP